MWIQVLRWSCRRWNCCTVSELSLRRFVVQTVFPRCVWRVFLGLEMKMLQWCFIRKWSLRAGSGNFLTFSGQLKFSYLLWDSYRAKPLANASDKKVTWTAKTEQDLFIVVYWGEWYINLCALEKGWNGADCRLMLFFWDVGYTQQIYILVAWNLKRIIIFTSY